MSTQRDEPHIEMDSLQPEGRHWLHAKATQGDVEARIDIRPYPDARYPGGYVLDTYYDRANPSAPGGMGRRQQARAQALLQLLREQVTAAMQAAGWQTFAKTPTGTLLWHYEGPSQPVQHAESLPAPAQKLITYQRLMQTKPITFVCDWCQQEVTQQRYPGPRPRYCSERCQQEAIREQTRARVQRLRAKRRHASAAGSEHEQGL